MAFALCRVRFAFSMHMLRLKQVRLDHQLRLAPLEASMLLFTAYFNGSCTAVPVLVPVSATSAPPIMLSAADPI